MTILTVVAVGLVTVHFGRKTEAAIVDRMTSAVRMAAPSATAAAWKFDAAGAKRILESLAADRDFVSGLILDERGNLMQGAEIDRGPRQNLTAEAVLAGKRVDRSASHVFTYSRIVRCRSCNYSLIAERQKGHVYYRCHNRPFKNPAHCPPTSIREEQLDEAVLSRLRDIDLSDDELALARTSLEERKKEREKNRTVTINGLRLQLDQMQSRLEKLADVLVDGTIDKSLFQNKQNTLLREQARIKEQLAEIEKGASISLVNLENTVELAKSPSLLYKTASPERKRQLLKTLLSNLVVSEKKVEITLTLPFRLIAERDKTSIGRPYRGTCRTWEEILEKLKVHFQNQSPAS